MQRKLQGIEPVPHDLNANAHPVPIALGQSSWKLVKYYKYINKLLFSLENKKMRPFIPFVCVDLKFRPGHVCKKKLHISQCNLCPLTKTNNHQIFHPFIFYKKGNKTILIYNRVWLYRYNCTCTFFVNESKRLL